jgi:class 3 adenylate cyclase
MIDPNRSGVDHWASGIGFARSAWNNTGPCFAKATSTGAARSRVHARDHRRAYHRCCADLIERNGGFVAKYMGDGMLAYFGYPQAHEHDAERAVQAGLGIVEATPKLVTSDRRKTFRAGRRQRKRLKLRRPPKGFSEGTA